MTIHLELKPEVRDRLLLQARARGTSLEEYLTALIEAQSTKGVSPPPVTQKEFEAFLDAMAEDGEHLPVLSDEDLTREVIYGDHD